MKCLFVAVLSTLMALGAGAASAQQKAVHVRISPQNGSGESGTALLVPEGDGTKVTVSLKGQPAGASQPMHIHKGSCANLDPDPAYGLSNVVGGKSTTVVPVSMTSLLGEKQLAINVTRARRTSRPTSLAATSRRASKRSADGAGRTMARGSRFARNSSI